VVRCNIERLQDGRRKVTYTPVEVGIFTITVAWNGQEIPGILISVIYQVCICTVHINFCLPTQRVQSV